MILAIVGPTGVGKTKMSIALAHKYKAIIINADAMQIYQDLNIGTAKIKEEEKEGIKHYLFDISSPLENYTVFQYQKDVRDILEKHKNENIIFVGGTGLYLKAALYDYQFAEEESKGNFEKYSNEELYQLALKKDENMTIHQNNRRRIIRFLERKENKEPAKILYPAIIIGLTTNREQLYDKINIRVDKMIEEGLIEEAKKFYDKNIFSKALQTAIGYKELYQYFDNKITKEEAIELIKKILDIMPKDNIHGFVINFLLLGLK